MRRLHARFLQVVNAMPRILSAAATSLPTDADMLSAQTFSASKIAKESEQALEALEKTSKLHEDFIKPSIAKGPFANARAIYDLANESDSRTRESGRQDGNRRRRTLLRRFRLSLMGY